MKKNILVIVGGNYISGAEKVTLDVMQGLKEAGHVLFCITSEWTDGVFASRLSKLGINFKPLKLGWYYLSNLKWSADSLIHYPASFIRFYKLIKTNKYDLVYTMSYRYLVLLYPALKKNIIYHVHDPSRHSRQSRFFLHLINKKVIRYIAVSEFIKRDLIACGIEPAKVEVIHNGVETMPEPDVKIKSNNKPIIIGIIGQVIQRKGHEDILQALSILKKEQLQVSLVIVGKGDEKFIEKLKLLIAENGLTENVEWRNFRENLTDIYDGIDIVVAPTRNDEPFALVALEANMLSIPVIATNTGGFPESIIDGINGFLIEVNNPVQLADKLRVFYNDRPLVTELGKNGRKRMVNFFTKERMISSIHKLIEQ